MTTTTTTTTLDFDALRREATKLERHLEERVARYQQLAQRLSSVDSLLQAAEAGTDDEAALRNDITRTLAALTDLVQTKLAAASERSAKHALIVKRFREIIFDLQSDFTKACANYNRRKEQLELFAGATMVLDNNNNNNNEQDEAMQHLMRERQHISNSLHTSAAVLSQASEIHADMRQQGLALRGVQGVVVRITQNVPGLNRLVELIRRRRAREDYIVSGVIATCILFTLWYVFG